MEDKKNTFNKKSFFQTSFFMFLVVIASLSAAATLMYYFSKVDLNGANNPQVFGVFGDYVGGVLNPAFSFLALIALLWTIALQSKELSTSREELALSREEMARSANAAEASKNISEKQLENIISSSKKEEVLRLISILDSEIESHLKYEFDAISVKGSSFGVDMNGSPFVPKIYQLFGKLKDKDKRNILPKHIDPDDLEDLSSAKENMRKLKPFLELIIEMSHFLDLYDRHSDEQTITNFYRRKHHHMVWDIYEIGYIPTELIDKFNCSQLPLSDELGNRSRALS